MFLGSQASGIWKDPGRGVAGGHEHGHPYYWEPGDTWRQMNNIHREDRQIYIGSSINSNPVNIKSLLLEACAARIVLTH